MSDNITPHSGNEDSAIPAELTWVDGLPYSSKFQDVYFSSDNGLLETEYVFLQGNDLPIRWQQADIKNFTIIETGFGTGLNFLCAAKLWLATAPEHAVLHFISVEKYPLSLSDISTALALWPELSELSTPLIHQYESLMNTTSISLYNHRIQLSVYIGDATDQLARITHVADAWLFSEMAKHAKRSTTFATFTSAGHVRRSLIKAGFKVNKRTGFGKKREMLCGEFIGKPHG